MFRSITSPGRARRNESRRPSIEQLDGRWLLTGVVGSHIGVSVAEIVGNHIGAPVTQIVGNHIGAPVAQIVGNHIGTNVAQPVELSLNFTKID